MVERRRFGATEPTVKIDSKSYVLATQNGRPVFSSGTRAIEGAPSDDFEITIDDWSDGLAGQNMYFSENCLTVMPGRLMPSPTVSYLTDAGLNPTGVSYWFETQDSAGTTYLYGVGLTTIIKIEMAATPVFRAVISTSGGAPFNVNDLFGQPARGLQAAATAKWYVPCNNGDRMMRLTTVGIGAAADTWTAVTTVIGGARAFKELPNGKVVRALNDASDPKISILVAGALFETDANWGGDFPVADQGSAIINLSSFDDLIIVHKFDGHFSAVERGDGSLEWRDLLPDGKKFITGTASLVKGLTWHGRLYLGDPANWWRHNLASAIPVGPDAVIGNYGDEPNISNEVRFGQMLTAEHGGQWQYAPYDMPGQNGMHLLAGREPQGAERNEITWHTLYKPDANTVSVGPVWVQVNGAGAPRLFWHENRVADRIAYMDLGADRGPYKPGGSYGAVSDSGHFYSRERIFESRALFQEVRIEVENGVAELGWEAGVHRDGGALETLTGSLTATGSLFWTPGTNDTARRAYFRIRWVASGAYTPAANTTRLRKVTIRGAYLPDVSDSLQMVIDVAATARRRRVSEKSVRDALRALRNAGAKTFVDPYGQSGQIAVAGTSDSAPSKMAALENLAVVSVTGSLLEYT